MDAPDHADGVAIRQEEDPAADATSEPAGSDEGDARTRPGTAADGTAGEEGDRGHQEDGEGGPDGQFLQFIKIIRWSV